MACFHQLPELLLPQRIRTIRSLTLYLHLENFPHSSEETNRWYRQIWQQISEMPGLRELRLWLSLPLCNLQGWRATEESVLAPIAEMRPLDRFEVVLPVVSGSLSEDARFGACHVLGAEQATMLPSYY